MRAWALPLGACLLAPLLTWVPLGPAARNPVLGMDLWPAQLWWLMAFVLVGAIVGAQDRWLGVALMLAGSVIFWRGFGFNITHALYFMCGALTLWIVRQTPRARHPLIRRLLAAWGLFQAVYMLQQAWLQYDVLWGPLLGLTPSPKIEPLGTLGTVDASSAYIAITAPLMPVWALPVAVAAVFTGRSYGAILALIVGLALAYRHVLPRRWLTVGVLAGLAGLAVTAYWKELGGVWVRLAMWRFGLLDWWAHDPLMGFGLGTWSQRIPALQIQQQYAPTRELFREAHSEWVQWLYETGAVGAIVLAAWLREHRAMFAHATLGASLAALAVVSTSFFTFHVVPVALLGIVLVGLATSDHPQGDFAWRC